MIDGIREHFGDIPILVYTNGKLMPRVPRELFETMSWRLMEYPGWNDDVIREYSGKGNVLLIPYKPFINPLNDPHLSEQQAKDVRENCMFSVRIIGDRLHGCCLSDMHERTYGELNLSCRFDEDWKRNWDRLETWRACQHCTTGMSLR